MTAIAAETKREKAQRLREAANAKRREARVLREKIEALECEGYLLDAEADEATGDLDHAEFHRALGTPGADSRAAYIRLRAKQYVRNGEHYDKEPAERRAEIEAEAAKLREPRCESCQDAGRIGDAACDCKAGDPCREPMSETSRAISEALRPVNLQTVAKRVLGVKL